MSVLTANTLFHFTNKNALLGILGSGFRPSYSLEFGPNTMDDELKETKIPMVCFCDLPLSKLEKHINGYSWRFNDNEYTSKSYGKFGLGMTKDWGRRFRLNPVTYVNPGSYLLEFAGTSSNVLYNLYNEYKEIWKNDPVDEVIKNYYNNPLARMMSFGSPPMPLSFKTYDEIEIALSHAIALISYMKPYRDSTTGQRYYDEREWRYTIPYPRGYRGDVPILRRVGDTFVPIIGYQEGQEFDIEVANKIILENHSLGFNANEIKYIIVEKDSDVPAVIERLNEIPKVYTPEVINRLTARIITCEQLAEDF